MPELPEVETTVRGINEYLKGLVITDAWTDYGGKFNLGKDTIKDPSFFEMFRASVRNTKILNAKRRGKNILINLSCGKTILIHMKMTGHVMYGEYILEGQTWRATMPGPLRDDPFNKWIHFVLSFTNGKHMVLSDMRKFAKVTIDDTSHIHESKHLFSHGPEPLDPSFTVQEFKKILLKKPNGPIKQTMMNHEIISGVGNIYSDEILWKVGLHPLTHIKNIPPRKWKEVFDAMQATLKRGIDFGGDSMSDYRNILGERGKFQEKHSAYRKTGTACAKPGCKGFIIRRKMGGRNAHFCDIHQILYT